MCWGRALPIRVLKHATQQGLIKEDNFLWYWRITINIYLKKREKEFKYLNSDILIKKMSKNLYYIFRTSNPYFRNSLNFPWKEEVNHKLSCGWTCPANVFELPSGKRSYYVVKNYHIISITWLLVSKWRSIVIFVC